MRGLLLKDWYVARKNCRLYLAVIVITSVLFVFLETGAAYLLYPILFAGMIPIMILAVEEKTGWNDYSLTLPVTRRQIVSEKYIASLITVGGTCLFLALLWLVRLLVLGGDAYALARLPAQLLCYGVLIPAVSLPPMLRLGVEKGRAVTMAVAVAVALVIVMLSMRADEIGQPDIAARMGWHIPVLALIAAAVFALSWLLSIWLYEKREL